MDQFLVICALTQFLLGIEKLSHKQQILSQQHYFGKIYVKREHVCYVKLSQKKPNFEITKPAWTCRDSNTIFTPVERILDIEVLQKCVYVQTSHFWIGHHFPKVVSLMNTFWIKVTFKKFNFILGINAKTFLTGQKTTFY